jgi:hypothetical protein
MQPHVHLGRIAHLLLGTSEFGREPGPSPAMNRLVVAVLTSSTASLAQPGSSPVQVFGTFRG